MLQSAVNDDFDGALDARWTCTCPGGGTLETAESALRLVLPGAAQGRYSDAQIDDYSGLRLRRFPWRPPLRMEVRACASHPVLPADGAATDAPQTALQGTAGFGFWNYPLTAAGGIPRLPDAVWFFAASPPSNMALVPGSPGNGWKAQVVHAHRPGALLVGLPTASAAGWARLTGREAAAARWIERLTGTHEAVLGADLTEWHDYALEWRAEEARFWRAGAGGARSTAGSAGFCGLDRQSVRGGDAARGVALRHAGERAGVAGARLAAHHAADVLTARPHSRRVGRGSDIESVRLVVLDGSAA